MFVENYDGGVLEWQESKAHKVFSLAYVEFWKRCL